MAIQLLAPQTVRAKLSLDPDPSIDISTEVLDFGSGMCGAFKLEAFRLTHIYFQFPAPTVLGVTPERRIRTIGPFI